MRAPAFLLPAILLALPLAAGTKTFTPDTNHTILGFKASTLLFDVPGRFEKYKLDIQGDPADLSTAKVRVELDTKSINTENAARDKHLRTEDFFDAAKFPRIVFTSEKAWREGDKVVVQGSLDLHGVVRTLRITFTEATGVNGAGNPTWAYKATLPIKRSDFGIGADSVAAKISLKDEVDLNLLLVGFFNEASPAPAPRHSRKK